MRRLPRNLEIKDSDPILWALRLIREFARDTISSLSGVPDVEYREVPINQGAITVDGGSFATSFVTAPSAVLIAYVENKDGVTMVNSASFTWRWSLGGIRIPSVSIDPVGHIYTVRFMVVE